MDSEEAILSSAGTLSTVFDTINEYVSLPLSALVLLFALWQARRDARVLLGLLPAVVLLGAMALIPGVSGSWLMRLVSIFSLSLTALWLEMGWLGVCSVRGRVLWAHAILLGAGAVGLVQYPRLALGIAEQICFTIALVWGFVLVRRSAGPRLHVPRFAAVLFAWDIFLMTVAWVTARFVVDLTPTGNSLFHFLISYHMTAAIAVAAGVGLFFLSMSFVLFALCSAFHRERFLRALSATSVGLTRATEESAVQPAGRIGVKRATVVFALAFGAMVGPSLHYGVFLLSMNLPSLGEDEAAATEEIELPPPDLPTREPISLDFDVLTLDGASVNLATQSEGRVVFLNFWATWCFPCRAEMPSIERLFREMGSEVVFACISNEPPDTIRSFLEEHDYTFPVYRTDGSRPAHFDTDGIPATFIVSAEGERVLKHVGGADWSHASVVAFIRKLTGE